MQHQRDHVIRVGVRVQVDASEAEQHTFAVRLAAWPRLARQQRLAEHFVEPRFALEPIAAGRRLALQVHPQPSVARLVRAHAVPVEDPRAAVAVELVGADQAVVLRHGSFSPARLGEDNPGFPGPAPGRRQ